VHIPTDITRRRIGTWQAIGAGLLWAASLAAAAESAPGPRLETDRFLIQFLPRTPEQVAAFYEARGLPDVARAEIARACFITVHIENRGEDLIWLDVPGWHIQGPDGPVERIPRAWWFERLREIGTPAAGRSTFRWTLLPEQRDLLPTESVGGNITLQRTDRPFTITAWFDTGADRRGDPIRVEFRNLRCPRGEGAP